MTSITPAALADRLVGGSGPVVLDVRPAEEFEDWHVPTSRNVDVYDALREDPTAAREALGGLPADREIVTVCGIGVVSQTATELLREMGYEATTLAEGLVGWSRLHRVAPVPIDVPGTLLQVARPGTGCLSYVLVSAGRGAVFDPSQYVDDYETVLGDHDADLGAVYETHAHADHLSGGPRLAESAGVPYHLHEADAVAVDAAPIAEGDGFEVGEIAVEVLYTPGHSPGSVTYDIEGAALLTGDTVFHERVGRVELGAAVGLDDTDVEANADRLYGSVRRVIDRPDDTLILPAHDPGSPDPPVTATVAEVVRRNPDTRRDRAEFVSRLASNDVALPANARRIKRANVGLESVAAAERATIELGPNRCAAP